MRETATIYTATVAEMKRMHILLTSQVCSRQLLTYLILFLR